LKDEFEEQAKAEIGLIFYKMRNRKNPATDAEILQALEVAEAEMPDIKDEPTEIKVKPIFQHDKRSGLTYVYISDDCWDEQLRDFHPKRTIIGRVDTQDYLSGRFMHMTVDELQPHLIPTGKRGRKKKAD
jgi:hypothetical protein